MNFGRSLKTFLSDPSLGLLPLLRAWWRARACGQRLHVIIMAGGLGDIVAADPAIRAIIRPDEYVVVLVRPGYLSAFTFNPHVREAIRVDAYAQAILLRTMCPWPRWSNLHVDAHRCNVLNIPISNRNKAGITAQNYYEHGTLADVYALTTCGHILGEPPKIYPDPAFLSQAYLAEMFANAGAPLLIIHTQATEPVRSWPAEHLRVAMDLILARTSMNILEMGLTPSLSAHGRVNSPGDKLTLPQQMAVMQAGALFLGVDSGFAHIANALHLPSVLMLGAYKGFQDYLPWTLHPGDILLRSETALKDISSAGVVEAISRLLSGVTRPAKNSGAQDIFQPPL